MREHAASGLCCSPSSVLAERQLGFFRAAWYYFAPADSFFLHLRAASFPVPAAQVTYSSDYFQQLYEYALRLIRSGNAYVDHQTPDEIKACRRAQTRTLTHLRSVQIRSEHARVGHSGRVGWRPTVQAEPAGARQSMADYEGLN